MSPRPIGEGRTREPGIDLHARDVAHSLGISAHGRWFTYDTLLDWAVKQYWANRLRPRVEDVA